MTVLDARPDVLNHNTETVPRLYRMARSGGRYARTLELLDRVAPLRAGHSDQDRRDGGARRRARRAGRDVPGSARAPAASILTIGQYLRPTAAHAPMVRYYHPDEFARAQTASRSTWASCTSNRVRSCAARTTPTRPPTPTHARPKRKPSLRRAVFSAGRRASPGRRTLPPTPSSSR